MDSPRGPAAPLAVGHYAAIRDRDIVTRYELSLCPWPLAGALGYTRHGAEGRIHEALTKSSVDTKGFS